MGKGSWKNWTLGAAGVYFIGVAATGGSGLSAVIGIGLLMAASEPNRHWPVASIALMASLWEAVGPARNPWGLVWIAPLAFILKGAYDSQLGRKRILSGEVARMGMRARTQQGMTLEEMSTRWPTMVVFLRHFGCTFCREAMADLAAQRAAIEEGGVRIVLVHMSSDTDAESFFARYGMEHVARISDPGQAVYRAFGLARGRLTQLFGPRVWKRGFEAGILKGHGVGMLAGDGFQMPGIFVVFHGEILRSFRHQSAADRPDYAELAAPVPYPETV